MENTKQDFMKLYKFLKASKDKKILFITTSNRFKEQNQVPKSSILANKLLYKFKNSSIIDASKLNIYMCEGNVSNHDGNKCGIKEAILKDEFKNPSGNIRCFAAMHNEDDELYIIANAIFDADIIIFFGSIRWGKMNAVYARLIERLTWIENRRTTLKEEDLLKGKIAGVVAVGHNWNAQNAINHEQEVLNSIGFQTPNELFFKWSYMNNADDEDARKYEQDYIEFLEEFDFTNDLK